MRTRKEVVIDGVKYDIGPIVVTKAVKLMTKITKILGPSLVKMLRSAKSGDFDLKEMEIDGGSIESVLTEFFDRVDEDTMEKVSKEILANTIHCGDGSDKGYGKITDVNFDMVFDRGIMHLFNVLKEAFGVTYSDFFGESGGFQAKFKATLASFQKNTK